MAEHAWSILCSRALVDQGTQNLSLMDVIDEVGVESATPDQAILVPVGWQLVTLWRRSQRTEPERALFRLSMRGPNGVTVPPLEGQILLDSHVRYRVTAGFAAITFQGSGTYEFIIEQKPLSGGQWTEVGLVPLDVTVRPLGAQP